MSSKTDLKDTTMDFYQQRESENAITLLVALTSNIDLADNRNSLVKCIFKAALPNLSMWIQKERERWMHLFSFVMIVEYDCKQRHLGFALLVFRTSPSIINS